MLNSCGGVVILVLFLGSGIWGSNSLGLCCLFELGSLFMLLNHRTIHFVFLMKWMCSFVGFQFYL